MTSMLRAPGNQWTGVVAAHLLVGIDRIYLSCSPEPAEIAPATIDWARLTNGGSIMRPSRTNAARPSFAAVRAAATMRSAVASSAALALNTSLATGTWAG
ncbi:MAG: hypothetical protein ABIQ36_09010 [Rhodanobacter sp.]